MTLPGFAVEVQVVRLERSAPLQAGLPGEPVYGMTPEAGLPKGFVQEHIEQHHMMQFAVTGQPAAPMPDRISSWGIYDVFQVQGGEQIFLAVVSDTQWAIFCDAFGYQDLKADPRLQGNNNRVRARDWLIPLLRERLALQKVAELAALFERHGLPFAPITKPHELLDDPHLCATGGLAAITLPDGERAGQTAQTVL
eukprot:gene40066-52912_t